MTIPRRHLHAYAASISLAAVAALVACGEAQHAPALDPSPVATAIPVGSDSPPSVGSASTDLNALGPVDSGLAWCTPATPDETREPSALSPATAMRVFSGRCMPTDHYYRACDDAGLPVYVPPCGDENTGTHLEITTAGRVSVSVAAHSIDVIPGPLSGGTWALGPQERAILAKVVTKTGGSLRDDVRVVATSFADDWHLPSEEFAEVVPNAPGRAFTFWRKGVCIESVGCTIVRWEASAKGLRFVTSEKDVYDHARTRLRSEMPLAREKSLACPLPSILAAARIYAMSRILGDSEKTATTEFGHLTAGLSTAHCPGGASGHAKSVPAIRQELAKGMKQLLARANR